MNLGKEFEKFAIKERGISSNTLHGYTNHMVTNLTPNIIEERPMNVAVMDVYSRLMMDRIIFSRGFTKYDPANFHSRSSRSWSGWFNGIDLRKES